VNNKELIKKQVLDTIANGKNWQVAKGQGPAKWKIGNKIVHVRYRSGPKADGITYSYNINQNTLKSEYEIWICGDATSYYLIPINEIQDIYNDPGAYIDKWHPDLRVADINTQTHRASYSRRGITKDFSSYFCAVLFSSVEQDNTSNVASPSFQKTPSQTIEPTLPEDSSTQTPKAKDLSEPGETTRSLTTTYRILRDTGLARKIKTLYKFECQICGHTIHLRNGQGYAEAHHIKPLGAPHNGPDAPENILCLCPNHHVQLDYGIISIKKSELRIVDGHSVGDEYIEYHNSEIVEILIADNSQNK
jgi:hypothetical protein